MSRFFLTALLASLAVDASAAVPADGCTDGHEQSNLNRCAAEDLQAQDKRLNQVYSAYRKRLNSRQQQQLKEAQRAWISFRDSACAFQASAVEGGSAYAMILGACLAERTSTRATELEQLATCEEGDLSCPAPLR